MKYRSMFTEDIYVNSPEDAYNAIVHFCSYCKKDSIEQYHCSGHHARICQEIKDQIQKDWSNNDERNIDRKL